MSDPLNSEPIKQDSEERKDTDEDFEMEYSDEEFRSKDGIEWEPEPDEIIELFEKLEKEKVLELDWTTPGRRPPTPTVNIDPTNEENNSSDNKKDENTDFDFQDEMSNLKLSANSIRPAGSDAGPRGSAKKKTPTSLDAILSNMARHRKLDMMEDDDEDPLP